MSGRYVPFPLTAAELAARDPESEKVGQVAWITDEGNRLVVVQGADGSRSWVPLGAQAVSGLQDVDLDGLEIGDTIVWDGTAWVPGAPAGGGGGTTAEPMTVQTNSGDLELVFASDGSVVQVRS